MVSISAHQTLDGKVRIEGSYQPTENEMRSIHRLIERMTKGGGRGFLSCPEVVCPCGLAFPLAHHYQAVLRSVS